MSVVPAHALLECFSVLTRLPGGRHLSPANAAETIAAMDLEPLDLPAAEQREVIVTLARAGLGGGAVYAGLTAAIALAHDLTLVSLDRRAAGTYEAMSVEFLML